MEWVVVGTIVSVVLYLTVGFLQPYCWVILCKFH